MLLLWSIPGKAGEPRTLELAARPTLCVAELNHGDTFRFRLVNGEARKFVLESTRAWIVEEGQGGTVYGFECQLLADGQALTLRRFVCSQETFYEPWVVNGVRIWISSSASVFERIPIRYGEDHYPLDGFDAILAIQDAVLPICPDPMQPWFPMDQRFIDVGRCYNGDDPWLGPYLGEACHVGLDINMPKGTPLFAPIDFDDNWIFSADHRWRGIRRWDHGEAWGLQSHHVDKLLINEGTAVAAGTHYAEAAGKGVGSHPHSHFEFRVGPEALHRGRLAGIELDPWILFWQIFETDKQSKGEAQAIIDPLSPTVTGQPVKFSAANSRTGADAGPVRFYWSFGEGGWSAEPSPQHVFTRPGVFPVTLVMDDGQRLTTQTQHMTVNGQPLDESSLVLDVPDDVTFRRRPAFAADVYGWPVKFVPHTLRLSALPAGPVTAAKEIRLINAGGGELPQSETPAINYLGGADGWLRIDTANANAEQRLRLAVDPGELRQGRYQAIVSVTCPGAINAEQAFRVELIVRPSPNSDEVAVDDRDDAFFATPFAWVGHQLQRCEQKGYRERYLTNGGITDSDAIARFTPDLAAGRYELFFHPDAPLGDSLIPIRVRHASGTDAIRFEPTKAGQRPLGRFEFAEGTDGFVEIMAAGSRGLVVADAVVFRRLSDSAGE